MKPERLIAFGLMSLLALPPEAAAVVIQVNVPGSANPNLAGRADGYACCSGDASPSQAATEVAGLGFAPADVLTFTVFGQVSYLGAPVTGDNPDGDEVFSMTNFGDGISAPESVRVNSLLGLFLADESPTGGVTPAPLSFLDSGLDFVVLAPDIGQIFFIGNGRRQEGIPPVDGAPQAFIVPAGATRLFLGTGDGVGWYNNSGSFTVNVLATARSCGDATSTLDVTASDALFLLNVAVSLETGALCVCDADGSGTVNASDARLVLLYAVGLPVELGCPACAG